MIFELRVARQAARCLQRLDTTMQRRIIERLDEITAEPYGLQTKPLGDARTFRSARVGAYRIIFSVDEDELVIDVAAIGPRGQIYRELE